MMIRSIIIFSLLAISLLFSSASYAFENDFVRIPIPDQWQEAETLEQYRYNKNTGEITFLHVLDFKNKHGVKAECSFMHTKDFKNSFVGKAIDSADRAYTILEYAVYGIVDFYKSIDIPITVIKSPDDRDYLGIEIYAQDPTVHKGKKAHVLHVFSIDGQRNLLRIFCSAPETNKAGREYSYWTYGNLIGGISMINKVSKQPKLLEQ